MSIFDKLRENGISLPSLFAEFVSAISALDDEDTGALTEEDKLHGETVEGVEDPVYYCEDFPGRRFFQKDYLDPESPEWALGVEIGLPEDAVVHLSPNQNHLLPLADEEY